MLLQVCSFSVNNQLVLFPFMNLFFACRSSPVHIFAHSNSLHSYARPPLASNSAPSPARSHMRERRRTRVEYLAVDYNWIIRTYMHMAMGYVHFYDFMIWQLHYTQINLLYKVQFLTLF